MKKKSRKKSETFLRFPSFQPGWSSGVNQPAVDFVGVDSKDWLFELILHIKEVFSVILVSFTAVV